MNAFTDPSVTFKTFLFSTELPTSENAGPEQWLLSQSLPVSRDSKSLELTLMGWTWGLWIIDPEFHNESERVDVPSVPFSLFLNVGKIKKKIINDINY